MNTPQFHQSEINDDIVDYISLSVIETEKRRMQYPEQGHPTPVVHEDNMDLEHLTSLLAALKQVTGQVFQVQARFPYFRVTTCPGWEGLMRGSPVKLYALLQQSAQFSVHPYLWNFLNNFGDLDMREVVGQWFCDADEADSLADHLNARVVSLRADLRSHHTAIAVDNRRRGYRSNLASLRGYVSDLFARYSRLLVVRLDLGYRQGLSLNPLMAQYKVAVSTQPEYGVSPPHEQFMPQIHHVAIGQIQQHREALLDFIRDTYSEDFCGYAWKLEYGARKGYHYHLLLFFNGANLRSDVAIGALIGNRWNRVITAGLGNYYNCNAAPNRYWHPCIGSQSWNSPDMERGMDCLCAYLMKPDLYARLELGPGQRTFGRGGSPLRGWADQPRRGRPRTTGETGYVFTPPSLTRPPSPSTR